MTGRSPLERLRERAEAETAKAEIFLPIPGVRWAGELVAKITPAGPEEALQHADQVAVEAEMGVERTATDRNADMVAMFTNGLYLRDASGRLDAIPGPVGGAPMRFGHDFAAAIGDTATTPRAAVFAAFTEYVGNDEITVPVLNVTGLSSFARNVAFWVADTSREIAEAIVSGR